METGEAGPPGEMTSSKLPKGTDGIMMPVQGFAGAPGETQPQPHMQYTTLFRATYVFVLFHSIPTKTHRHPPDQNSRELR